VCDADVDTLQALVEKSLVRHTNERFWMLETIRKYAVERFDELAEVNALRRGHAEHFAVLAEEGAAHFYGPECGRWYAHLSDELDNLRAGLVFARESGDGELLLRLAGALGRRFFEQRGHLREGRAWLEEALAMSDAPAEARAFALWGISALALSQGDDAAARAYADAETAFARSRGDPLGIHHGLAVLAQVSTRQGDIDHASALWEESAEYALEPGFGPGRAAATSSLSVIAIEQEDHERALELASEGIRLAKAVGDRWLEATALNSAAYAAFQLGQTDLAVEDMHEAIRVYAETGVLDGLMYALVDLAEMATSMGSTEHAARLLGASDALGERGGYVLDPLNLATRKRALERVRTELREQAELALAKGRAMSLDEAVEHALSDIH
jgi:tetratricopeptide (TPR) repeat protein